jgi:DNA repair protein RadC
VGGRIVSRVHARQVAELGVRPLDRAVGDHPTRELLGVVMGGSVAADIVDAIASEIDSGVFVSAVERPDELSSAGDIPPRAAACLMAAFELARRAAAPEPPDVVRGPPDVAAIACRQIGGLRRERVIVIVCDAVNRPVRSVVVADGAIDRSLMPVREILNAVLCCDGRAFAIAHNHPCGELEPSDADGAATRGIAEAARVVGLRFLGHVVVAGCRHQTVQELTGSQTPG